MVEGEGSKYLVLKEVKCDPDDDDGCEAPAHRLVFFCFLEVQIQRDAEEVAMLHNLADTQLIFLLHRFVS